MPQKSSNGTARKAVPGKEEMMRKGRLELSVVQPRRWMMVDKDEAGPFTQRANTL